MTCSEHPHLSLRAFFAIGFLTFSVLQTCNSANLADELRITLEQKALMDKLRQTMLPHITEGWMKDDLTLLRYIRASNFKLDEAQRKMMETIKWRKKFKMATIHQEDFSDMFDEFPWVMTHDKEGEPVGVAYIGEWDFRNAVITGRAERLSRHVYRAVEIAVRNVRELQYQGHNVTRFNLLFDIGGFNLVKHACVVCVVRLLDGVFINDQHYPGSLDRAIAVNTPASILALIDTLRNAANPETFRRVTLYGHDRSVWQKKLLELIDMKDLPVEFGGKLSRT